jgi:predicted AAA+ superfamily ATPase
MLKIYILEYYGIQFHNILYFCYMIPRSASIKMLQLAGSFKSVALIGPRQSGKTTLVKSLFPDKPYVNLENPDTRRYAIDDPRGFLSEFPQGAVLDEVQRTPDIFSYLQFILDSEPAAGQFILTGSNNFQLQQNISQSLSGRVAYLHLLPLACDELFKQEELQETDVDTLIIKGFYPPIHDQPLSHRDWHANYVRTYVERDVRQIKNITDLLTFERFMRLLAGRVGTDLNMHALAVEVGVDTKTIQAWISILAGSFVVFLLKPFYKNFNKTITKRPKVYFYDTGLLCYLLGIHEGDQLKLHPLRSHIFECMVVADLVKKRSNKGFEINLYYWRDKHNREIDVIIDHGEELIPVEIKSGKTIHPEYFKHLIHWLELSGQPKGVLLYGGDQKQQRTSGIQVWPLNQLADRDFLTIK